MHSMSSRLILAILVTLSRLVAQESPERWHETLAALPELGEAQMAREDWLLHPDGFPARVGRTSLPNEIALDNGLLRRTFRLSPNAATVGFDDLVSGNAILRSVRPEARLTLDGIEYQVGGLVGQENHAFLRPEQLDALRADPRAMRLVDFAVSVPRERFAWKRVRHHAPNVSWPPRGVALRLDFAMPRLSDEELLQVLAERDTPRSTGDDTPHPAPESELARHLLYEDALDELHESWQVHASTPHERSSFANEGKPGEIYTPANSACFAEHPLPEGARLVEVRVFSGTDTSASWGPGMALVFGDRVLKFHLRPGGNAYDGHPLFGAWDGTREHAHFGGRMPVDTSRAWTLRMRLVDERVLCDARKDGGTWANYGVLPRPEGAARPTALRIGKLDLQGGGSDHATAGDLVRCRVSHVRVFSDLDPAALEHARESLRAANDVRVSLHYELYDSIPALSKWMTVSNATQRKLVVDRFTAEELAVVEHANWVETREGVPLPRPQSLHVETDFAFGGFQPANANRHVVHWRTDPLFATQVNWARQTPCLLVVEPTYGPAQDVDPGATFETFRTFELVQSSTDRERRGLAYRRMYRTIAPWVTENPLMHHMRTADFDAVRRAIDQAEEVGFEMIILSFGSGFDVENDDPAYVARWKEIATYARERGIEIGGYSLLSSRHIGNGNDVVSPEGSRPTHGSCPALTSEWGQTYYRKLYSFFEQTGFHVLEHDGPYPGDVDVTPRPPLQKGEQDSRWAQWHIAAGFYRWCREQGIYVNAPDYYYLNGTTQCGMGYREVNWSLPRDQQVLHTRQNIYDGTWLKTPSMGWMFVPLTQYHGGGAAATIEPLDEHRAHYERMLTSNLGLGVQACYRGPRLFDTDRTHALVKRWVTWFKRYRTILESDVVHGRRADGRDLDWMLHVDPVGEIKGMLVVYNPLDRDVAKTLRVNVYYTGLTERVSVAHEDGPPVMVDVPRDDRIDLEVDVPAGSMTWYVLR
ncbi:MAG: hypothetical protein H6833_10180 [Planctomycetes bacterium]|nr:hypothetical protein [Planctomycetota bacterium]